jgi:hypothetical protein
MRSILLYRISLVFSILLTLVAFVTLLGWFGTLINGMGRLPVLSLIPWSTLGLVAVAALNCTLRARLIVHRHK